LGELGGVGVVCRGEVNEAGEMCDDCVEGGDVGEAELAECVLENRYAGRGGGGGGIGGGWRGIDCFDDVVKARGDEGVGEFEEIKLEDTGDNGDLVPFEEVKEIRLAVVKFVAQVMGRRERDVDEPNTAASFITVQ